MIRGVAILTGLCITWLVFDIDASLYVVTLSPVIYVRLTRPSSPLITKTMGRETPTLVACQNLHPDDALVPRDSVESFDIKTALATGPHEAILTTSLSFISSTSSTHSLFEIPSFPLHEAALPLFLNVISCSPFFKDDKQIISVPTSPRLKAMLMEPIVVDCWVVSSSLYLIRDASYHFWSLQKRLPLNASEHEMPEPPEDAHPSPPWVPEGCIFPPERFSTLFKHCHNGGEKPPMVEDISDASDQEHSLCVEVCSEDPSQQPDERSTSMPSSGSEYSESGLGVPTIMLSNSTAAVPLSFESSQSIAPLAVRRGHKVPAPLTLSSSKDPPYSLYPDVPTPFRGTPSALTPQFEFTTSSSADPSMDFRTMCQNLRSRCPSLRPESPNVELSISTESSANSSRSEPTWNDDSDDWAFAKDILDQHGDRFTKLENEIQEILDTPLRMSPDIADITPGSGMCTPQTDSYSWGNSPTLEHSPESPDETSETDQVPSNVDIPKQQRRRTVIIETPRNSVVGEARPSRTTIDLSHLADTDADPDDAPLSPEFDKPIPFESPRPRSNTAPSICESTPARPMSSGSMRGPVRSILKSRGKKSVRFSVMPSMHEYPEDETETSIDADALKKGDTEPRAQGRKRSATEPAYRPQNQTPAPALKTQTPPPRTGLPKHPAVRSFMRGSSAPSPTPPPRTSHFGGARQSLPLSHVLVPRNVDKSEVGPPRKLLKRTTLDSPSSSTSPLKSGRRKTLTNDENNGRRASVAKSRMSAPFKFFTKLRA